MDFIKNYYNIAAVVYGEKAYEMVESHEVSVYKPFAYKILSTDDTFSGFVAEENRVTYDDVEYVVVRFGGLRKVVDSRVYIEKQIANILLKRFEPDQRESILDELWAERKRLIAEEAWIRAEAEFESKRND